jgi:hypothetical protein
VKEARERRKERTEGGDRKGGEKEQEVVTARENKPKKRR